MYCNTLSQVVLELSYTHMHMHVDMSAHINPSSRKLFLLDYFFAYTSLYAFCNMLIQWKLKVFMKEATVGSRLITKAFDCNMLTSSCSNLMLELWTCIATYLVNIISCMGTSCRTYPLFQLNRTDPFLCMFSDH